MPRLTTGLTKQHIDMWPHYSMKFTAFTFTKTHFLAWLSAGHLSYWIMFSGSMVGLFQKFVRIISGEPSFKPRAAGWEARILPMCQWHDLCFTWSWSCFKTTNVYYYLTSSQPAELLSLRFPIEIYGWWLSIALILPKTEEGVRLAHFLW